MTEPAEEATASTSAGGQVGSARSLRRRRNGRRSNANAIETIDWTPIRKAARGEAERMGLRPLARRLGSSPTGLRNFLGGAVPYTRMERVYTDWYRNRCMETSAVADALSTAIQVILDHVEPAGRDGVRAYLDEVTTRPTSADSVAE
jgi:hypothetical protein